MLKSKSRSFTLEKPKQSEGWIKIQEWDRRWNKILSIIFGVLSFMLLFAIVLANTMSTAAVLPSPPPDITSTPIFELTTTEVSSTVESTDFSTITDWQTTIWDSATDGQKGEEDTSERYQPSTHGSTAFIEFCFMSSCNITCTNGRINHLTWIIDTFHRESQCKEINLELNHCSFPRRKILKNWLKTTANINTLKIMNSHIKYIEDKSFTSRCFEKLQTLVMMNVEVQKLCSKNTFKGLEALQRLELINLPLRFFRNEVFVPFANSLNVLVFEEMLLANFPVQNITGNFSKSLSSVKYVSLKYNHLGPLNEFSFAALQNVIIMELGESNIPKLDSRTFDHSRFLKYLSLRGNNIESIPSRVFDLILKNEGALIDLLGNPLKCNCGLKQLQTYLDTPKTRYMFSFPLTCMLPSECWEEFVSDCNTCDKSINPTPTPTVPSPKPPSTHIIETTEVNPLQPTENISSTEKPPNEKPDHPDEKHVTCFNQAAFITLMITSLLLSAAVGAVCLFCSIRHCSALIKRAKFTFTPKKCPTSEVASYPPRASVTPRSSTSKPPFLRSLSDTSIGSGRSYVSAINPPRFSNISWRMDKANYIYQNSIYLEDNFLDRPPPLPPHPRRNSSLTTDAPSTRTTSMYTTNENIYELYE